MQADGLDQQDCAVSLLQLASVSLHVAAAAALWVRQGALMLQQGRSNLAAWQGLVVLPDVQHLLLAVLQDRSLAGDQAGRTDLGQYEVQPQELLPLTLEP